MRGLAGQRTVVFTSHDLERAARLADQGLLLVGGRGRTLEGSVLADPAALAAAIAPPYGASA